MILAVMDAIIFCNCVEKPKKVRTSLRFEPMTSQFCCNVLTNWAITLLTLGVGHVWVLMFLWGTNQWWNYVWNEPSIEMLIWSQVSHDPRSYWFIPHGNIRTHTRPAPKVSGFIAQLVRVSHWNSEVMGSNLVEVLTSPHNCKNCVHNCEEHSLLVQWVVKFQWHALTCISNIIDLMFYGP